MDLVLDVADDAFFDDLYPSSWERGYWARQALSLFVLAYTSGTILYLTTASFNYFFLFNKGLERHPQFLKNQKRREISVAMASIPFMIAFTVPLFFAEVRGYSKLFDGVPQGPIEWMHCIRDIIGFTFFTDFAIYWVHRMMHHRLLYRYIHKVHHIWKVPTPFASHAFDPFDGFLQSLPYHVYPFLFPLNKYAYLILFVLVNIWTISIHDGDYRVPAIIRPFINGSAHHTDHHLYFNYNYGQYFTLWDRIGGSFKNPTVFDDKYKSDWNGTEHILIKQHKK